MEERIHAGQEDRRDKAESDRDRGARLDQQSEDPDGEVRQDDARNLTEAPAAVDLQVGGEILFPALAGWDVCGRHGESVVS